MNTKLWEHRHLDAKKICQRTNQQDNPTAVLCKVRGLPLVELLGSLTDQHTESPKDAVLRSVESTRARKEPKTKTVEYQLSKRAAGIWPLSHDQVKSLQSAVGRVTEEGTEIRLDSITSHGRGDTTTATSSGRETQWQSECHARRRHFFLSLCFWF